jgi:hypothetical protein
MAFLDNSGDIILDAVLTDLGRKRLAEGNFKISQFALGDDEIDYSLYDKNHPSGSAYYDLEILQTPVFEAFTQTNANINYGLINLRTDDILYLPTMILNQKVETPRNTPLYSGIGYVAANGSLDGADITTDLGAVENWLGSGDTNKGFLFETGLNSSDGVPDRTQPNRDEYLVSTGLVDQQFMVSYDRRFIAGIYGISNTSTFMVNTDGTVAMSINYLTALAPTVSAPALDNYVTTMIRGINNMVFRSDGTTADIDLNYSEVNGPRAATTGFGIRVTTDVRGAGTTSPAYYSLYGKTNVSIGSAASGETYDYIDTMIYIMGTTSGVTTQLPVRIVRKRG